MAEKKKAAILIDQDKLQTLSRLKEEGFDTANKIKALGGREIYVAGLTDEMGNIFDIQDAIKANHSEIAWLLDGEDPKPVRKEGARDEQTDGRSNSEVGYIY